MKQFYVLLVACLFAFATTAEAQSELEILKIPDGYEPAIDGFDDDDVWMDDNWIPMEVEVDGATTTGLSSEFQILHNDEFIFILQRVWDNTPNSDHENTWERDNIEIFFHMSDDLGNGSYTGSTSQIRFQRDDELIDGTDVYNDLLDDDRFEWAVIDEGDHYILEAAFPIDVLDGDTLFDGTNFHFDIKAADNTGEGRTQQLYWGTDDDMKYEDITNLLPVELSTTEIDVATSNFTAASKVEAGSVYVHNNMLRFNNVEGTFYIYSITGALVKTGVAEGNSSIEISWLNPGVYIVKTESITTKFVK